MAWSTYMIARVVKHCLREGAAMGANTGAYLSLHTADPGLTGASEVVVGGSSYTRQAVNGTGTFPTVTGDTVTNSAAAINFTLMPACTVTHVGLWDTVGPVTGNFIMGQSIDAQQVVNANDTFGFATSALTLSLAATRGYSTYLGIQLLKHVLLQATFGQPAALGLALHTADPAETGANEVTGGTYLRQVPSFANAAAGVKALNAIADFTLMPACTVNYISVWDNITNASGNCLFIQTVAALAKTVNALNTFRVPGAAAGFQVTIS